MMNMPDMWLNQAPDGRRFAAAIGLGLLLEVAALGLTLRLAAHQPPPAQLPSPVKITIIAPPAPKPPPPQPVPPPPQPVPPQPVTPPRPVPPPPRPAAHHVVRHVVPPRPVPPPPQVVQPPQPVAPPAPPRPVPPSMGEVDLFRLAMRQAVQAVANDVYPPGAANAHESGAPQISFTYLDGAVSDIAVARSSGYPLLDAAAMQAVRIAHYPPEPADFHGQAERITVAVIFQLAAPSVDAD